MQISTDDLPILISDYLQLVTHGSETPISDLRLYLDQLAIAAQLLDGNDIPLEDSELRDVNLESYGIWRSRAELIFEDLGYYNIARPVAGALGQGELLTGDAIDDIVDIARDLQEVSLLWDVSQTEAVWHYLWGFQNHWGIHLRDLQLYLQMSPLGW